MFDYISCYTIYYMLSNSPVTFIGKVYTTTQILFFTDSIILLE